MFFPTLLSMAVLGTSLVPAALAKPLWTRQGWSNNATNTTNELYCGKLTDPILFTFGDHDNGGPGFVLRDADYSNLAQQHYYFLYENSRDTRPWKFTLLQPGSEAFISVCPTFHGRLVRGNPSFNLAGTVNNLGTWVEMGWEDLGVAWGDVSLLEGCDGAATIAALDGTGSIVGFDQDIISGSPSNVLATKRDGSVVIAKSVGTDANLLARQYELTLLSPTTQASIVNAYKPVIGSRNARFNITMYPGRY